MPGLTPWRRAGYDAIEFARKDAMAWARENGVPMHKIEYVATFEDWDKGTGVWVFYETDEQLARAASDGTTERVKATLLEAFRRHHYPFDSHPNVVFAFDSHETVQRDYEGSYFYRLR